MNTILIGVDGSERSEDAIAFGGRIAAGSGAEVIVACAFPYGRALRLRHAARRRARHRPRDEPQARGRSGATGLDPRARRLPRAGPARAGDRDHASLVVVGSTHTGHLGRVYPGSTGEKLLHGAPCAVAIVPRGYDEQPVGKVGVAYDGSDEAKAALESAVELAGRSAPSSS